MNNGQSPSITIRLHSSISPVKMIEKFNLKWNNFEQSSLKTFTSLRHDKTLVDITLVANDQVRIQAHKIVLSSCSPFFSNLVVSMPTNNPFLYLSNVSSTFLNLMLDYLYTGETEVLQADLETFLKSAKMMEIDGLTFGEELLNEGIGEEGFEQKHAVDARKTEDNADKHIPEITKEARIASELENIIETELKHENIQVPQIKEEILDVPPAKIPEKKERKKYAPRSQNPKSIPMNNPKDAKEIDQKINENIEAREDGTFRCKVCNRINKNRVTTGHHIESHMEGVEFGCLMCDQKFRSRHYLSKHVCPVYTEQKAKKAIV